MILDRKQFGKYWDDFANHTNLGSDGRAIWRTADLRRGGSPIQWFVKIKPIEPWAEIQSQYWDWCHRNLEGDLVCYSSGDEDEWWGFENKHDIVLWLLRWSGTS
jgi:hypothetical protein